MKSIFESASKIVFLLVALTASTAFLWGVFTGSVVMGTEHFMALAGMAFGFYFAHKGEVGKEFRGK